jgi:hypothetical protein
MAAWLDGSPELLAILPAVPPDMSEAEQERMRRIVGGLAGLELVTAVRRYLELLDIENEIGEAAIKEWHERCELAESRMQVAADVVSHFGREDLPFRQTDPELFHAQTRIMGELVEHRRIKVDKLSQDAQLAWLSKDMYLLAQLRGTLVKQ